MIPKELLQIRCLQVFRSLIKIPLHALVILIAVGVLMKISFDAFGVLRYSFYIICVIIGSAISIQHNRSDKRFIFRYLEHPSWQIYLEYAFFSTLLTIGSWFHGKWYLYIFVQLVLFLISRWHTYSHYKTPLKNLSSWIPSYNFELISGVRKSYFIIVPFYLTAFIFCWIKFLPLLMIWFININVIGYFNESESLQMVTANNLSRWRFLIKKIHINILFLMLMYVPIFALQIYFHFDHLWLFVLFFISQWLLLIFSIVQKYALYEPTTHVMGNGILLAIVSFFALVPYGVPILLLLDIWFFFKAYQNLKTYLS